MCVRLGWALMRVPGEWGCLALMLRSGGCFDEPISCCVGSHLRLEMYVCLLAYTEKYKVFEKGRN